MKDLTENLQLTQRQKLDYRGLMTKQPAKTEPFLTKEYKGLLKEIKEKVLSSQLKAAVAVNSELIKLYWEIGNTVIQKQKTEGWGKKTIERLAKDLMSTFPDMKGFSFRNIKYMVQFAKEYPDLPIGQQPVAQIPWGHNILLLDKVKDLDSRIWYIQQTIENGWSRSVLLHWVDSGLHNRQAKAVTNFQKTLPSTHSDLAHETLKDPYNFDFLTLREKFDEKELEDGLLNHIQKFLLELGAGFSFVGRQIHLEVGNQDFFVDLLFYHLKLRSFVVVELKATEFKPEHAGKMNFYLTAVDKTMKHKDDNPTIGLLLCKTKNKVVAEYALQDINKPLGVAEYETQIIESLPEDLKGSLPTIEEIEQEFEGEKE
jgi:predicted nuclease of restriction endonuclease-like (RecB) superfamily